MKFIQVISFFLVIILYPNFISSQRTWLKLNENTVYNFLKKFTGSEVSKQVHSQGINMYISSKTYIKEFGENPDLIVTESYMVSFDSGIPVQYGESYFIKDLYRRGKFHNSDYFRKVLFDKSREDQIQKFSDNSTFEIAVDDKYHFEFRVKEKCCQEIPNTLKREFKLYNEGEYLIMLEGNVITRDIEDVRNELLYGKLDVSKINFYDIHNMIDVFIKEMKYFSHEYWAKNFGINYQNKSKVDSFIKMVENSNINVDFDLKTSGVLGISKSMNDDSKISISINPISWKNSSDSKKLYIIYHELGHDILNFKHGEGGKMMFPISENDYNYAEFYDDRKYMFNRFFEKLYFQ